MTINACEIGVAVHRLRFSVVKKGKCKTAFLNLAFIHFSEMALLNYLELVKLIKKNLTELLNYFYFNIVLLFKKFKLDKYWAF